MEGCRGLFFRYFGILMFICGAFSLPRRKPVKPICTSHGGLCDVTFEISENNPLLGSAKYTSSSELCSCPGKLTCPTNTSNPSRVYYQEMSSPGQTITTRLSYCDRKAVPSRDCNKYELAVTLRGVGPIIAEIVGDIKCKCSGPLCLHTAKPDGIYSVRQYTCGQPTCDVNTSTPPVCERVTHTLSMFGFGTESEIPCQCPDGFICNIDNPSTLGDMFGKPTEFHCEPKASRTGFV